METFATKAIESGTIPPDLYQVAAGVLAKLGAARNELRVARRRLAFERSNQPQATHEQVSNHDGEVDPDRTTTRLEPQTDLGDD